MTDNKRLYFIPIIAQALESDDPRRAMKEAFEEIRILGARKEYEEGFLQFQEFIKSTIKPSEEFSKKQLKLLRNAINRIIHDLGTDTFDGNEKQKEALIIALKKVPEWNEEYEYIKEETNALISPEKSLEIEILRENQCICSYPVSPDPAHIRSISPGKYTIQFSNGRLLWEGDLNKEDLIWAFAFPEEELEMAAETETSQRRPTRTISLLEGEITIRVFAGLESGQIRIESAENIWE
jgi:hypothetical protein